MAHSKQSHRSVEQGKTRQARRRQKIHQHTKKMRKKKFHNYEEVELIENNISRTKNNKQKVYNKNGIKNKQNPAKMKVNFAREFYSFFRKSHKTNLDLNQERISALNKLVQEERMQLKKKM